MKWRKRHTVGIVFLVLGTAFYVVFIHRGVEVREADGWRLRFSYAHFFCRVCSGYVEELTYDGKSVPVPDWRWETGDAISPRVNIHTPVGDFTSYNADHGWRQWHTGLHWEDAEAAVSADELSIGWYDARGEDHSKSSLPFGPFIRKRGTPAHWCLVATHDQARWVEPGKIGELEW